ncbi:response regulator transcription factor [Saccharibacillus sp. JS10]|uniref:response regulator n=1 Tax=Saccharibacillus sp. JS10 TaxID=2950552 RepID=UPI00210ED6BF|nr:response regulator transcription factor [Saccharibacillus sp. JS10]MCQ4087895.1 response regulator transcription factor [Saccharibacillus sp. JS10]
MTDTMQHSEAGSGEIAKILLVDDQPLVRQGMKYIIGAQPDLRVVGEAGSGPDAVAAALKEQPQLILMDVQMPEFNGIEATRRIIEQLPDCKIVILTTFDTEEYVLEGIRAGAIGYLLKDTEPEELLAAIRGALRGEVIFRTALAAKLIGQALQKQVAESESSVSIDERNASQRFADSRSIESAQLFTARELEVLQQMAYGLRNEEIAAKLFVGESTVKTHVHRILQKFDVQDRTQAVVYAIRNGIVE